MGVRSLLFLGSKKTICELIRSVFIWSVFYERCVFAIGFYLVLVS